MEMNISNRLKRLDMREEKINTTDYPNQNAKKGKRNEERCRRRHIGRSNGQMFPKLGPQTTVPRRVKTKKKGEKNLSITFKLLKMKTKKSSR